MRRALCLALAGLALALAAGCTPTVSGEARPALADLRQPLRRMRWCRSRLRRRSPAPGDFRCTVPLEPILPEGALPAEPLSLAKEIACSGKFSDVAVDMLFDGKRFWVLGLNFRYGTRGWPGHIQNRLKVIAAMIERGEL